MSVAPPGGQDRIMIYGPKSDGTYIIEFRMADASRWRSACRLERLAYSSISRRGCLTGWSCRTFREEPLPRPVSWRSGETYVLSPLYEGSRDPVLAHTRSGGVLVLANGARPRLAPRGKFRTKHN